MIISTLRVLHLTPYTNSPITNHNSLFFNNMPTQTFQDSTRKSLLRPERFWQSAT